MKNILITGANGLLGRYVCEDISRNGNNVFGLVHTVPISPLPQVTYLPIDLNSSWHTQDLPDHIDAIIHLAQSSKFRDFPDSALEIFRINIESTAKLLDYAKNAGVSNFILASSGGVYDTSEMAHTETSKLLPPEKLDYYLSSKITAEMLTLNYSRFFHTTILRFFFIYGTRQRRTMLIPRLLGNIRQGNKITLHGDEGLRINPIHVADASAAVLASLKLAESNIINVAGPDNLSLREICEAMGTTLGIPPVFDIHPGKATALLGDIQQMREKLHHPKIRLIDSINELINPSDGSNSG